MSLFFAFCIFNFEFAFSNWHLRFIFELNYAFNYVNYLSCTVFSPRLNALPMPTLPVGLLKCSAKLLRVVPSIRAMTAAVAVSTLLLLRLNDECTLVLWNMSTFQFFFSGVEQRCDMQMIYSAFRVLFSGLHPFVDAASLMMLLTNANTSSLRLVSFRTEVHYKLSHWTFPVDLFRFGFTWAILMNLRTILIVYCEGFEALLKQYALL